MLVLLHTFEEDEKW